MSTFDGHSRLARLALEAEVERLVRASRSARPSAGKAAGHHQPQGVGAAAGRVLLVAGDHVARAHRPAAGLAAGADARAHLDGAGEPALAGEVEDGRLGLVGVIVGADPEVVAGVGRGDDLAGVHPVVGVEGALDGLERGVDLGAEQLARSRGSGPGRRRARRSSRRRTRRPGRRPRARSPGAARPPRSVLTLMIGRMCRQPTSAWP